MASSYEREGGKACLDSNLFKIPWGGECKAKLLLRVDKQGSKQEYIYYFIYVLIYFENVTK